MLLWRCPRGEGEAQAQKFLDHSAITIQTKVHLKYYVESTYLCFSQLVWENCGKNQFPESCLWMDSAVAWVSSGTWAGAGQPVFPLAGAVYFS